MSHTPLANRHVGIIGAGLIGLCSAHYLQRAGATVTVYDRSHFGSGAARGNGGLIATTNAVPLPGPGVVRDALAHLFSAKSAFFVKPSAVPKLSPFLARFALRSSAAHHNSALAKLDLLTAHTTDLFRELSSEGIGTSMSEDGMLRCFTSMDNARAERAAFVRLLERGFAPDAGPLLDREQIRSVEPTVGPAVTAGYVLPGERWANPSSFVDELADSLKNRGVRLVENTPIDTIGEDVRGPYVVIDEAVVRFDDIVIAAGARSGALSAQFGVNIRQQPGKGYSFCVTPERLPSKVLMLSDTHCAIIPLDDGRVRIAGTMEFDGTYEHMNVKRLEQLRIAARANFSGIDWSTVEDEWVGARPMTTDGIPLIGPLTDTNRVVLATGHNMLGFALAPATASLVTDVISGRSADRANELKAFHPRRFQTRKVSA